MTQIRIIVTGSRDFDSIVEMQWWLSRILKSYTIDSDVKPILVHGGARGADAVADRVWRSYGYPVEVFEADWDIHGKAAGHIRNEQMAKAGADIVLAFPLGESKGTRGMMKIAERYGITLIDTSLHRKEVQKSMTEG